MLTRNKGETSLHSDLSFNPAVLSSSPPLGPVHTESTGCLPPINHFAFHPLGCYLRFIYSSIPKLVELGEQSKSSSPLHMMTE